MRDGLLVQVITHLADPGVFRRDHFAVASPDAGRARELVRAYREITDDQRLMDAGPLPDGFLGALCMLPDEVRALGCGSLERYPCRVEDHGLAGAPTLMAASHQD